MIGLSHCFSFHVQSSRGYRSTPNGNFKIKVVKNVDRRESMLIAPDKVHDGFDTFDLRHLARRHAWESISLELLGLDDDEYVGITEVTCLVNDTWNTGTFHDRVWCRARGTPQTEQCTRKIATA